MFLVLPVLLHPIYGSCGTTSFACSCEVWGASVLGHFLFIVYIQRLSSTILHFGLQHHIYADDTQLLASSLVFKLQQFCTTT